MANNTTVVITLSIIVIDVISSLECLIGFLGNVAIIVVLLSKRELRTPVNWLVFNLAISNLTIVVITIPYSLIDPFIDWPFGRIGCKYIVMPTMECFAVVCVSTHTTIAIARYFIIRKAGTKYALITNRFIAVMICVLWIVSYLFVSATLMGAFGKFKLNKDGKCSLKWSSNSHEKIYRICVFITMYVIPTSLTGFAFFQISHTLKRNLKSIRKQVNEDFLRIRRRGSRKINKTFLMMFILVTFTTFPYHLFMLLFNFQLLPYYDGIILTYNTVLVVFYAQVVINPVVLIYMSDEYKTEIRRIFGRRPAGVAQDLACKTIRNTNAILKLEPNQMCTSNALNERNFDGNDVVIYNHQSTNM